MFTKINMRTFTPLVTTSSSGAGSMQKSTTFFRHLLIDAKIYDKHDVSVFDTDESLYKIIGNIYVN